MGKNIVVDFVEHNKQRYDTVGDYGENEDYIWFRITWFPNKPAYSIAILIHEIAEFFRNKQEGITIKEVDDFDLSHPELEDPGLSKEAPYHKTHMESDIFERMFIQNSGEDWTDYEAAINDLSWKGFVA